MPGPLDPVAAVAPALLADQRWQRRVRRWVARELSPLLMEPIAEPGAENSRFPSPYRQYLPLLTPVLLHQPTMASSFSAEQIASLSAPPGSRQCSPA